MGLVGGWEGGGGCWSKLIFLTKNPNLKKKIFFFLGGGGGGGEEGGRGVLAGEGTRVSEFFLLRIQI